MSDYPLSPAGRKTTFPTDPQAAAGEYLQRGWAVIPLPSQAKRPAIAGWQSLRLGEPDFALLFTPDGNIGRLNGEPSSGAVDVDLDSEEARRAAAHILTPTDEVWGRESAPDSHYGYAVDVSPTAASEPFDDPVAHLTGHRKRLLEIRSTGSQTVVPPSVYPADPDAGHPAAERCVWSRNGGPARIMIGKLRSEAMALAAVALFARYWPRGARHDAAMALAGWLLRAGMDVATVIRIITAICFAAGDEEVKDRVRTVVDTAEKMTGRERLTTGWRKLIELLGPHGEVLVGTARRWFGVRNEKRSARSAAPISPYRPFPVHTLPAVPRQFVEAVAAAIGCDPAYCALPVLAIFGAVIGTSHVVSPKRGWKESPFVWVVTVGRSGAAKTPPFQLVEEIAEDINDKLEDEHKAAAAAHDSRVEEWVEKAKAIKAGDGDDPGPKPAPPVKQAFSKSDLTIEALVGALQANPRGLLIAVDELAGWISNFVRYAGKSGGSELAKWLQLHKAGVVNYTRKTGDVREVRVRGVGVSVAGTIQPRVLARVLTEEFRASGFLARLLLAMPPWAGRRWTEAEIGDEVRTEFAELVNELFRLPVGSWPDGRAKPHLVYLSDEAKGLFTDFYDKNGEALATADEDMAAAMSKLEGYALRFALIFHCARLKDYAKDARIRAADMAAAIELTTWFRDEAERVYTVLGQSAEQAATQQLHEVVCRLADRKAASRGGFRGVTARDLQNANSRKYPARETALAALETLVAAGLGDWSAGPPGDRAGGHHPQYFVPLPTHDTSDTRLGDDDDADDDREDGGSDTRPITPPPTPPSAPIPDTVTARGETGNGTPSATLPEQVSETSDVVAGSADDPIDSPSAEPNSGSTESECRTPNLSVGTTTHTVLVTDPAGLADVVAAVRAAGGRVGVDTETTGLNPRSDRIRLIQIATRTTTYVIDLFRLGDLHPLTDLFAALAGVEVVGHNLQFDIGFLGRLRFAPGKVFDTLIVSQVLHAGRTGTGGGWLSHKLADVANRELGIALDKREQTSDWTGDLTPDQLEYAARDTAVLLPLADAMTAKADAAGLTPTISVEMNCLPVLAELANTGIKFDSESWQKLASAAVARRDLLRAELDAMAGPTAVNWGSPVQVNAAFAAAGVSIPDTRAETLAGVDHQLAAKLLAYRGADKAANTYGAEWVRKYVAPDGRVYAGWHQCGAVTGRMSCSNPNLQQIPRGDEYRRCFVARHGHVLVGADYSQIEIRIAARVTGDLALTAAFQADQDVHRKTAARFRNLPVDQVTDADRKMAKPVNFGAIYGLGPDALRRKAKAEYKVDMTDAQARAFLDAFFLEYPGVRAWHSRLKRGGAGEVRTLGGRRIAVEPDGFYGQKANYIVQGTGGDGIKRALGLLAERRAECPTARPVLVIHDEIVLEVPEADAETAAAWLRRCMVDAIAPLLDPVPVTIDVAVGRTWAGD